MTTVKEAVEELLKVVDDEKCRKAASMFSEFKMNRAEHVHTLAQLQAQVIEDCPPEERVSVIKIMNALLVANLAARGMEIHFDP